MAVETTSHMDLRIERVSNSDVFQPSILDPWSPSASATTGDNVRDNVEQVWIENPVADETYIVRVTHKGNLEGGFQEVSMVLTGNISEPKPNFRLLSISQTDNDTITVMWPAVVGQRYELEASEDLINWFDKEIAVVATKPLVALEVEFPSGADRYFVRIVERE
jgi:hypothetical protein